MEWASDRGKKAANKGCLVNQVTAVDNWSCFCWEILGAELEQALGSFTA